jgi:hypothetical protein
MHTVKGTMATDRPERYAKQLAGHWARKGNTEEADDTTIIRFDSGQRVVMRPMPGRLEIEASVPDDGDPVRFAEVVKNHLERFGHRDELDVVWQLD